MNYRYVKFYTDLFYIPKKVGNTIPNYNKQYILASYIIRDLFWQFYFIILQDKKFINIFMSSILL